MLLRFSLLGVKSCRSGCHSPSVIDGTGRIAREMSIEQMTSKKVVSVQAELRGESDKR